MKTINIIENFCSFQGEGPDTGKRVLILRFKRCSRNCSFCDTALKMRISQEMKVSLKEIQKLVTNDHLNILISGGEPTFSTNLNQTIEIINQIDSNLFNVETNGHKLVELISKVNPEKNIHYMLSPKIFNSADLKE